MHLHSDGSNSFDGIKYLSYAQVNVLFFDNSLQFLIYFIGDKANANMCASILRAG